MLVKRQTSVLMRRTEQYKGILSYVCSLSLHLILASPNWSLFWKVSSLFPLPPPWHFNSAGNSTSRSLLKSDQGLLVKIHKGVSRSASWGRVKRLLPGSVWIDAASKNRCLKQPIHCSGPVVIQSLNSHRAWMIFLCLNQHLRGSAVGKQLLTRFASIG